jgi:hypothetical protein
MSYNRLSWGWLLEVVQVSNAIAHAVDDVRQMLERCFKAESSSMAFSLEKNEALLAFYEEVASLKGKSLPELLSEVREASQNYAPKALSLSNEIASTNDLSVKILKLHEKAILAADFVDSFWDILPPYCREELKELAFELLEEVKSENWWFNLIARIELFFPSLRSGKNLFAIFRDTTELLIASILNAAEQEDEDMKDLEDARAARMEARIEGTISWDQLKADLNLQ